MGLTNIPVFKTSQAENWQLLRDQVERVASRLQEDDEANHSLLDGLRRLYPDLAFDVETVVSKRVTVQDGLNVYSSSLTKVGS